MLVGITVLVQQAIFSGESRPAGQILKLARFVDVALLKR
jgi:hypothetical protein